MNKANKQGHISISAATHARLKAYCAERGIPMSQLVAAIAIKHVVGVERAQRRAARSIPRAIMDGESTLRDVKDRL